jgi:hypothetical protein
VNSSIEFVCVRPEHQTDSPRESLTMHEDAWAYCPSGGAAPNHAWKATAGFKVLTVAQAKQASA